MRATFGALALIFVLAGWNASAEQQETQLTPADQLAEQLLHLGYSLEDELEADMAGGFDILRRGGHRRPPVGRRPPHRRPPVRRPPHRPPHRRYPPYRPRPPRYEVVCWAENYRGRQFSARAYSPRFAQDEAMRRCYSVSRQCYALGCSGY